MIPLIVLAVVEAWIIAGLGFILNSFLSSHRELHAALLETKGEVRAAKALQPTPPSPAEARRKADPEPWARKQQIGLGDR